MPLTSFRSARFATGLLVLGFGQIALGQQSKPALTWDVIDRTNWEAFDNPDPQISDDGAYVAYTDSGRSVLRSTTSAFRKTFEADLHFVPGGHTVLELARDTLRLFSPESAEAIKEYTGVSAFGWHFVRTGSDTWLAFQRGSDLVVYNATTTQEHQYPNGTLISGPHPERGLLYREKTPQGERLHRLRLPALQDEVIAETRGRFDQAIQDSGGTVAALEFADTSSSAKPHLLVYDASAKAVRRFDDEALHLTTGYAIEDAPLEIAGSGQFVIFSQKTARPTWVGEPTDSSRKDTNQVALNIWSYKARSLPKVHVPSIFEDQEEIVPRTSFRTSLNVRTGTVVMLEQPADSLAENDPHPGRGPENGSYALASRAWAVRNNALGVLPVYHVIDLATGKRAALAIDHDDVWAVHMSPDGRHILLSTARQAYYVYDVLTKTYVRLTDSTLLTTTNGFEGYNGAVMWLDGGRSVLVNSDFDIWKLDITGRTAPLCITQHEGEHTHTVFRLLLSDERDLLSAPSAFYFWNDAPNISSNQLILLGQNVLSEDQGIYTFDLNGRVAPKPMMVGRYYLFDTFTGVGHTMSESNPKRVVKAADADAYIFVGSRVETGPNVYLVKGVEAPVALTRHNPYAPYNWMTSEVLNWRAPDHREHQGILFKPENFDPSKKYPVIVTYYEKNSGQLNAPETPERYMWTGFTRNIGYYVSNGYLVFIPDMYYKIGDLRHSVYNSVMPAVQELTKRPYVDAAHMGATGTSWGGTQTGWLVTTSGKTFAAAVAEVGSYDMFYMFYHNMDFAKNGQMRMRTTPWDEPQAYVGASAALFAPDVQTPLLLMNNDKDDLSVPVYGLEMFLYLRQLGKPAWLLEYAHQGHGVGRYFDHTEPDVVDYRTRNQQFFDHFLKGAPAPRWLAEAIPPHLQATDHGLETP